MKRGKLEVNGNRNCATHCRNGAGVSLFQWLTLLLSATLPPPNTTSLSQRHTTDDSIMPPPPRTLPAELLEAVRFLEQLPTDLSHKYQWNHFIKELYPKLHLPTFIRMESAISGLDEILFNNALIKSDFTIKHKAQPKIWTIWMAA